MDSIQSWPQAFVVVGVAICIAAICITAFRQM
jgi:hypothetical protein